MCLVHFAFFLLPSHLKAIKEGILTLPALTSDFVHWTLDATKCVLHLSDCISIFMTSNE